MAIKIQYDKKPTFLVVRQHFLPSHLQATILIFVSHQHMLKIKRIVCSVLPRKKRRKDPRLSPPSESETIVFYR